MKYGHKSCLEVFVSVSVVEVSEGEKRIQERIAQFSDSTMQDIVDNMATILGENYYTALERAAAQERAVEEVLERSKLKEKEEKR